MGSTKAEVQVSDDVANEFFRLWLDERMSYTCAVFGGERPADSTDSLEEAQLRKLGIIHDFAHITPEKRVLDIGCGWGANIEFLAPRPGGVVLATPCLPGVEGRGLRIHHQEGHAALDRGLAHLRRQRGVAARAHHRQEGRVLRRAVATGSGTIRSLGATRSLVATAPAFSGVARNVSVGAKQSVVTTTYAAGQSRGRRVKRSSRDEAGSFLRKREVVRCGEACGIVN
jgi:hypothetical protein